jgi:small-conductance mechanosensitive channel
VAAGAARVAQLTKDAATKDSAADALEVARAQLELDHDDLEDAQQDLARQGGDTRSRLERALQQHQAAAQQTEIAPKAQGEAPTGTLLEQFRAWLSLSEKARTLLAAEQQATARSLQMEKEHNGLESKADTAQPAPAAGADTSSGDDTGDTENVTDTVARLRKLSDQRKTLAELDKRIQDTQQLAGAYQTWATLVETRRRAVLHLLLRSLGGTLGIVLAAVVVGRILKRILLQKDRRSQHQLRVITNVATQGLAAVFILLIVFGPPSQLSTILGLTTAGLTVVLKDFIVAFIGWFVLMGRNGVRVGDWVEIEGVGGEVIEIGVLKTILLEMGNWTTTGHPTGRRVSFMNGYAMGNHYFNFSTGNQWLWDELQVTLPATGDPYKLSQQIYQVIEHETETDAAQAEQDWERVTHQYGIRPFTAKPAVDLRPGPTGLDVVVRYITRAPQRYEVKSKLFQSIVELLHGPAAQVVERS